jgi:hypothetical protein
MKEVLRTVATIANQATGDTARLALVTLILVVGAMAFIVYRLTL